MIVYSTNGHKHGGRADGRGNPLQDGLGMLVPSIKPTSLPVPMTALRGMEMQARTGLGAVLRYCRGKEPDAATRAIIEGRGDTIEVVDCTPTGTVAPPVDNFTPEYITGVTSSSPYGTVTEGYNPTQFATQMTAAQVAAMIGGTVVQSNWQGFSFSDDQYHIAWNGGVFNAGLVAQMIDRYGLAYTKARLAEEAKFGQGVDYIGGGVVTPTQLTAQSQVVFAGNAGSQSASGAGGSLVFRNTSGGSNNLLVVGQGWKVEIVGAPGQDVMLMGGKNGQELQYNAGKTDASGRFTLSGTATADQVGTWREKWFVGTKEVGSVTFQIVPASTSGGGGGGGAHDTHTPAGGGGGFMESISSLFGGGGSGGGGTAMSVSTGGASLSLGGMSPLLLAGIAVGAFFLLKGRK